MDATNPIIVLSFVSLNSELASGGVEPWRTQLQPGAASSRTSPLRPPLANAARPAPRPLGLVLAYEAGDLAWVLQRLRSTANALGIGSVVEVQRRDERGHLDQ
jgi:hypothetical protein